MKHGTRLERWEMVGRVLNVFRDGVEPAVWAAHLIDERAYIWLQTGHNGRLTAEDFAGGCRAVGRVKPDRAMLRDPHKSIRLLQESSPIRAEVLGEGEMWLQDLERFRVARNLWAHFDEISARLADGASESAERLLRGVDHPKALAAAERVADLRRDPRELALVPHPNWPKPAA